VHILAFVAGVALALAVLWDAFETVVLPRRVSRRIRLVRLFFVPLWKTYAEAMRRIPPGGRRETYLGYFGPVSNLLLLIAWAAALILAFGITYWGAGSPLTAPGGRAGFGTDLYMSGTTFFTLGLGDVAPRSGLARLIAVVEAGIGFAFLALVISYLPVVYNAFSRREAQITLLDAWASSPPAAGELLLRLGVHDHVPALAAFLRDWEVWAAETLESHIAYPNLCYFRSVHDNQSWLAALTMVLDTCALILVGVKDIPSRAAGLTFAMARHVAVDISQILNRAPYAPAHDRLGAADLARLRAALAAAGIGLREGAEPDAELARLRRMYEPYVTALSDYLLMPLPPFVMPDGQRDNWQKSRWK
jgi:hypothetical protein